MSYKKKTINIVFFLILQIVLTVFNFYSAQPAKALSMATEAELLE